MGRIVDYVQNWCNVPGHGPTITNTGQGEGGKNGFCCAVYRFDYEHHYRSDECSGCVGARGRGCRGVRAFPYSRRQEVSMEVGNVVRGRVCSPPPDHLFSREAS